MEGWQEAPPDFVEVGELPLSLADAFVALATGFVKAGPAQAWPVLGPVGKPGELVSAVGSVTAAEVVEAATQVGASLLAARDEKGRLPLNIQVGSQQVGFHQFLHLMATATLGSSGEIVIPDTDHAPPFARWLTTAMKRPNARSNFWMQCQYWTIKPVVWS